MRTDILAKRRGRRPLDLVLRWDSKEELPTLAVRRFRPGKRHGLPAVAPPWVRSGDPDRPFDFCGHLERLLRDIAARCPELSHVRSDQVLLCMTQARNANRHGLQARVTPLRFRNGALTRTRAGIVHQVQRYVVGRTEHLYLMTFCLPRFLDQNFEDKFVTIFHEMFHIGPRFDGDLRRHGGRYDLHSHSKKEYDRLMAQLARAYLASRPDPAAYDFLRLDFDQLVQRHGSVVGIVLPRPRIIPLVPPYHLARTAAAVSPGNRPKGATDRA